MKTSLRHLRKCFLHGCERQFELKEKWYFIVVFVSLWHYQGKPAGARATCPGSSAVLVLAQLFLLVLLVSYLLLVLLVSCLLLALFIALLLNCVAAFRPFGVLVLFVSGYPGPLLTGICHDRVWGLGQERI